MSNYAFIDSQNLNLGVRSMGWQIDYKKLRLYLKNKYNIDRAFMFIGLVANNQKLYTQLQAAGFILILSPPSYILRMAKKPLRATSTLSLYYMPLLLNTPIMIRRLLSAAMEISLVL